MLFYNWCSISLGNEMEWKQIRMVKGNVNCFVIKEIYSLYLIDYRGE